MVAPKEKPFDFESKSKTDFLKLYIEHCVKRTDAPPPFHQTVFFARLGNLLGRKGVHPLKPFPIWHNIFAFLVGRSRKTRKTTALKIGTHMLPLLTCRIRGSMEGLFDTLEDNPHTLLQVDEGKEFLLTCTGRGGYARQLLPFLSTMYDCPEIETRTLKKRKKEGGTQTILGAYVSLLVGIQPSAFEDVVTAELLDQGFFNRPLICYEDPQALKERDYFDTEDEPLIAQLRKLWGIAEDLVSDYGFIFKFDFETKILYHQKSKELRAFFEGNEDLDSLVEEGTVYLVKIADLFAFSRVISQVADKPKTPPNTPTPPPPPFPLSPRKAYPVYILGGKVGKTGEVGLISVTKTDLEQAFQFVKARLQSANRLFSHLREHFYIRRLLRQLERNKVQTHAAALRRFKFPARIFDEIVTTLEERRQLRVQKMNKGGTPMRKEQWIYSLISKEEWEREDELILEEEGKE